MPWAIPYMQCIPQVNNHHKSMLPDTVLCSFTFNPAAVFIYTELPLLCTHRLLLII